MSNLKTTPNDESVEAFLETVENENMKSEAYQILELMKEVSGEPARMWGKNMVGFGNYHYKYASGREGDWFLIGFSPRKQNHTVYLMSGFDMHDELLGKLGKYKTGKSCLYVKKLEDIELEVLKEMLRDSMAYTRELYRE